MAPSLGNFALWLSLFFGIFQFFIVQKKGGAYHLDGNYTPFGKVIKGMDVVDLINSQAIDSRESPINNIKMIFLLLITIP